MYNFMGISIILTAALVLNCLYAFFTTRTSLNMIGILMLNAAMELMISLSHFYNYGLYLDASGGSADPLVVYMNMGNIFLFVFLLGTVYVRILRPMIRSSQYKAE